MKRFFFAFTVLMFVVFVSIQAKQVKQFNFNDSENWTVFLKDSKVPVEQMFSFKNGVLQVGTGTQGYIRTSKMYKNYVLKLEWRWSVTKGNSGVLVHIQKPDSVWPKCFQIQQKIEAAGDIISMNGLWVDECTDKVKFTVAKKTQSSEKPIGEWNTMEVICKDATLTVYVNGVLQNKVTGLTRTKGFIGFQAEGQALEFRNPVLIK